MTLMKLSSCVHNKHRLSSCVCYDNTSKKAKSRIPNPQRVVNPPKKPQISEGFRESPMTTYVTTLYIQERVFDDFQSFD